MILIFCLILIIIYSCFIFVSVDMIKNVQSQAKSIHKNLEIERNELNQMEENIKSTKKHISNACQNRNREPSDVCYLIFHWRFDEVTSQILKNDQHMKRSYDDLLFPLHYFFILFSFFNVIIIRFIFEQPFRLFFYLKFICYSHLMYR